MHLDDRTQFKEPGLNSCRLDPGSRTHGLKIRRAVEQKFLSVARSSQSSLAPVLDSRNKYGGPKPPVTNHFFRYRALCIRLILLVFSTMPPASIPHFLPVGAGIRTDVSCSSSFDA